MRRELRPVRERRRSGGGEPDVGRLLVHRALVVGPHHGQGRFAVGLEREADDGVAADPRRPGEPGDLLAAVGDYDVPDEVRGNRPAVGVTEEPGIHGMGDDRVHHDHVAARDAVRHPDPSLADARMHQPHPLSVTCTRADAAQTSPVLVVPIARPQVVRFILMRVEMDTEPMAGVSWKAARCASGLWSTTRCTALTYLSAVIGRSLSMMTGTIRPSSATIGMSSVRCPRRIGFPPEISRRIRATSSFGTSGSSGPAYAARSRSLSRIEPEPIIPAAARSALRRK